MSHKAAASYSVPTATTRASTLTKGIQRHNSEELTAIDISAARGGCKLLRGMNPVLVEKTLLWPCSSCDLTFLAGYSWVLSPRALLGWRVLMVVYVVVTLVVIGLSDIARVYSLSFGIYCAQLVSCCACVACSCMSVLGRRKRFPKRASRGRKKAAQVVDTACIMLVQNVLALSVYNDIVVATRDHVSATSQASFKLLHWYNVLPGGCELIVGCAQFEARHFSPLLALKALALASAFAARYVPWLPRLPQLYDDVWHDDSCAAALLVVLQMAIIGTLSALAVLGAQKARQALIRRM